MSIMLDSHSADDKAMAPFLVDIAKLHIAQGNLEEAESYYQKALPLINSSYGPEHLYTANVLAGVSKLFILQKRYDEAKDLIDRAAAVQEEVYGSGHHVLAESWLIKAKLCHVKKDYAQAEKLINMVLDAIEKSGNAPAFAKLQRYVKELRISEPVAYAQSARTIE